MKIFIKWFAKPQALNGKVYILRLQPTKINKRLREKRSLIQSICRVHRTVYCAQTSSEAEQSHRMPQKGKTTQLNRQQQYKVP